MTDVKPRVKPDVNRLSPISTPGIYLLLAFLILLVGLVLGLSRYNEQVYLVWLSALFLFTLSAFLTGRIEEGDWAGYVNLAVMVAWLILGPEPTITMILFGIATSTLARLSTGVPAQTALLQAFSRIIISVSGLLTASVLYMLLGGHLPLQVDQSNAAPLVAAILGGFAATQVVGYWVTVHFSALEAKPLWTAEERFRLVSELALLPAIMVLPLIAQHVGVWAFAIVMILAGINGAYLRQLSQTAQQNATLYAQSKDLVHNLSVINQSVQSVLFNLNSEEALRAACQSAMTITHAQKAAIFVLDADRKYLQLTEAIGLQEAHRQRVAQHPFQLDADEKPRVVTDTESVKDDPDLTELAKIGQFRAFVAMPLRSGHVVLGYLNVYHDQPRVYHDTELDLLETLANQITAGLDNAQLLRALELYAFEMTQLVHLSRISASSLDLERLVTSIPDNLRHMMSVSYASVALLDNGQVYLLKTASNSTPTEDRTQMRFPEFQAITDRNLSKRHTFQRGDDQLSEGLTHFMSEQSLAALIMVPIVGNNALLGIILLGSEGPHVFSDREWQLIETATNQIAAQISNARTYSLTHAALNRRLDQLSVIEDIVRQISAAVDLNQIISLVLDAAIRTTHADVAMLAMLTDANEFWIISHQYAQGELQKYYLSRPMDQGVIGEVARTGKWMVVSDNNAVPYYVTSFPGAYQSSLGVPLIEDDMVAGVLLVESTQKNFFTEEQASFLKNLAGHTLISIENARLLEALRYQLGTLISLRELSLQLSSAVDTEEVATAVLATAVVIFRAQDAAIFHCEPKGEQLTVLASLWADDQEHADAETRILQIAAQQTARTGELQLVENLRTNAAYEVPESTNYQALFAVPIKRGGQVREVMCVAFTELQSFEDSELNTMHLLASQAAGHLENATLHEQIRENNDRMQAILDSTRDGVILLDREGQLAEANPSAQQLLGINLSEHIGEHFVTLLLKQLGTDETEHSVYSRDDATALARFLRLEPERITSRQFERRTAKRLTYIEEIGSPVLDEHNQIAGRLLTLRDITEQKLLEAYRDDITQMAVHDLRSPLASIINALGLTLESLEENSGDAASSLTMGLALMSARNLMNLVDTMMDIAKLERRALPLRPAPTSIAQLVESATTTLAPSIQQAGVTLEIKVAPDLPPVNVDAEKVHRVLVNLVDNASRYTPSPGKILVSAERMSRRGRVLVRVADTGPGIPPEDRERVFSKFVQLQSRDPQRGHKGSGLGLTFCKLVIEAHGERIWVEQQCDLPGACIAFTLPTA